MQGFGNCDADSHFLDKDREKLVQFENVVDHCRTHLIMHGEIVIKVRESAVKKTAR